MGVRIFRAGNFEAMRGKSAELMVIEIESGVLPRDQQQRFNSTLGESVGDRRQLDRFRPGADDQPNFP